MKDKLKMRRTILSALIVLLSAALSQADNTPGNNIPDVTYNPQDGHLLVGTDGAELISVIIEGPAAMSIEKWTNGSTEDGVTNWQQEYFAGAEQWVGAGSAIASGFVAQGSYHIATYATGLTAADFGAVEIGTQNFSTITTDVTILGSVPCDFDGDGDCDIMDVDNLLYNGVANNDAAFDINGSGTVDLDDLDEWLGIAGNRNIGTPYVRGDANLDGVVDAVDLNAVGVNWQLVNVDSYAKGDFNGDGTVVAVDLNEVGVNWLHGAPAGAQSVPEPSNALAIAMAGLVLLGIRRRR